MNRHRLPSLHLVVGFEAAARLQSFKLAAKELSLTPSAISQRVRRLEDGLGVTLFKRNVRGIEITPVGAEYQKEIRRVVADLWNVTQRFSAARRSAVTVAMTSLVAQEMVIPNLRTSPGIDAIDIVTRPSMKTFEPEDADAGIRIGIGPWPGFEYRDIGSLKTVPLCAPILANQIRDWDDLFEQTLFCARSRKPETIASLRHPRAGARPANIVEFQTLAEAIRAAEAGLGVVSGLMPLMNNFVRQGRLVPAFSETNSSDERIAFIFRTGHPDSERLEAIYSWLKDCYCALPSLEVRRASTTQPYRKRTGQGNAKPRTKLN